VLAEHQARLRERQILRIVAGQPQTIAGTERRDGVLDRMPDEPQIAIPIGLDLQCARRQHQRRIVVRQRFHPAIRPQPVHVPLRQYGPQPRRQAAAAVKVAEKGLALARVLAEPEEVRV
jgi:hypothetical protein